MDRVKIIIYSILLLVFFWAGQATNASNMTIVELMTALSGVGSLLTAYLAYLAYSRWREQTETKFNIDYLQKLKVDIYQLSLDLTEVVPNDAGFLRTLNTPKHVLSLTPRVTSERSVINYELSLDKIDEFNSSFHRYKMASFVMNEKPLLSKEIEEINDLISVIEHGCKNRTGVKKDVLHELSFKCYEFLFKQNK